MPPAVAPPPHSGTAARGRWSTTEPAFVPGSRTPEPALRPAAAARSAAAGILLAAAAVPLSLIAIATLAALWLLFAGAERIEFGLTSQGLLVSGYALAYVATLATPNRWVVPRTGTLVLAVIASVTWPVSGAPLLVVVVAVVVVGLALGLDLRAVRAPRGPWPAAVLAGAAFVAVVAGLAFAETGRLAGAGDGRRAAAAAQAQAEREAAEQARRAERRARAAETRAAAAGGDARGDVAPDRAAPDPTDFIRAYYAALDARRFEDAWAMLSPAVQRALGPFERWRGGYARTLSSEPRDFVVEGSTVRHVLVARDRGCATRRFQVTWRLQGERVTSLSASALDGIRC